MQESRLKKRLRRISRAHALFSFVLFGLYVALSVFYSPEFFVSDIRDRFRALADDTITVAATVLAPPEKPVVTATPFCNTTTGILSVELDWADDSGTDYWDIDRDSLPLVSGVSSSSYSDTTVSVATTYMYVVTAYGPMGPGVAVSDPIVVTTPSECEIVLPSATGAVTAFDGRGVGSYEGTPSTMTRRPLFEGTTNVANAEISFLINDTSVISALGAANAGGYWSWIPPVNLSYGTHTLFVTITDPGNSSRTTSFSFLFRIVKEEEDEDDDERPAIGREYTEPPEGFAGTPIIGIPLDFSLDIAHEEILQGETLPILVTITSLDPKYDRTDAVIRYSVLDSEGREKVSALEDATLFEGSVVRSNVAIPKFLKEGKYRIKVEIIVGSYNISREAEFRVLPLPILDLGGGAVVTYPELLHNLGTIAILLFLFFFIWLFLFFREYWLYLHSLRHITERQLARLGFFGGRDAGVLR